MPVALAYTKSWQLPVSRLHMEEHCPMDLTPDIWTYILGAQTEFEAVVEKYSGSGFRFAVTRSKMKIRIMF